MTKFSVADRNGDLSDFVSSLYDAIMTALGYVNHGTAWAKLIDVPTLQPQPGGPMRKGFTLIELMIVIAIIAIIAAIAIPSLLDSRISANETAAAGSIKAGIHAGQALFSKGAFSDIDGDGIGEYATDHRWLAGAVQPTAAVGNNNSARVLAFIPPTYNVTDGTAIGPYQYQIDTDTGSTDAAYSNAESFFVCYAVPGKPGSDGRRAFAITIAGVVYATKQTVTDANLTLATVAPSGGAFMFTSDPTSSNPTCNTSNAAPNQR